MMVVLGIKNISDNYFCSVTNFSNQPMLIFDMDFTIKTNVDIEQRLDPPTVIFKFRKHVLTYNCESTNELVF